MFTPFVSVEGVLTPGTTLPLALHGTIRHSTVRADRSHRPGGVAAGEDGKSVPGANQLEQDFRSFR